MSTNSHANFDGDHIRLMSLDTSTLASGVAIWSNGQLLVSHAIVLSKDMPMDKRLAVMISKLYDDLNQHIPHVVYIEECVVTRNAATQRFLVRLQGALYAWCLLNNCRFETIRPTQWRKLLGFNQGRNIKRPELKAQAVSHITENYYIPDHIFSEDECEAICIGEAALIIMSASEPQDKKEKKNERKNRRKKAVDDGSNSTVGS